nr:S8 family serine peptidase [Longispora sp. (in: high G+C Gram-positive bacteria)]
MGASLRVVAARLVVARLVVAATVGGLLLGAPTFGYAATIREQSWHLDYLKIDQAHAITQGEGITVAVVDSGVDATHPDLQGQVLPGVGIGPGTAPDGRQDSDGHGTAMAGIIAGKGGGGNHVLGIAPKAKILPVAIGKKPGADKVAQGIRWAVDNGADVINISMGSPLLIVAPVEKEAVTYALSKNVPIVAAAGNVDAGDLTVLVPAAIPGVVAVSGIAKVGLAWSGSVQG